MTPKEFTVIAEHVWGGRGWQIRFAREIEVTTQTVSNWVTEKTPIPVVVQMYVKLRWETLNELGEINA